MTEDEIKALQAAHDGYKAANLKNQTELDRQLQLHKDKDAAHAKELADKNAAHEEVFKKQADWTSSELAAIKKQYEQELVNLKAKIAADHATEIAVLKEKTLIPALRDLQARQAADLKASHDAELAALTK